MLDTVKLLDTGRYFSLVLYLLLSIGGSTTLSLFSREEEMVIVYLAIACGFGALVRYFFSRYNQASKLPLGTLIANLLGCFLIGVFYNHVESKEVYAILATGFCGGLTTFRP